MPRIFVMAFFVVIMMVNGCNRNQEDLDAIEQEAVDREIAAVLDSLERLENSRPAAYGGESTSVAAAGRPQATESDVQSLEPVLPEPLRDQPESLAVEESPVTSSGEAEASLVQPDSTSPVEQGFVVQLGTYNNRDLASHWVEEYRGLDYPAFLSEVVINAHTCYRVRIGVYATYQEAKTVGQALAARNSTSYWIDRHR